MTKLRITFLAVVVLSLSEPVAACDLKLTIRPHTDHVVFGDPLYVEVTIVNRSEEPVSGRPPSLPLLTLWFTISDPSTRFSFTHSVGGAGGGKPIVFEPHKPVKYYCYFFLPRFYLFDNPFWKRLRGGGELNISGVYAFRPGVTLNSGHHFVTVKARPEEEIASLDYWNKREIKREDYIKGPAPSDFHLPVHTANREEMGEFAFHSLLSGELGDLVELSLLFLDVYDSPPDAREAGNRKLVGWLQKPPWGKRSGEFYMFPSPEGGEERVRYYPEVKRRVLSREARDLASSYNMRSTAQAIQTLIEAK